MFANAFGGHFCTFKANHNRTQPPRHPPVVSYERTPGVCTADASRVWVVFSVYKLPATQISLCACVRARNSMNVNVLVREYMLGIIVERSMPGIVLHPFSPVSMFRSLVYALCESPMPLHLLRSPVRTDIRWYTGCTVMQYMFSEVKGLACHSTHMHAHVSVI